MIVSSVSLNAQHAIGPIAGINLPFVNFTDFVIDARYNGTVMPTNYVGLSYRYQSHKNVGFQFDLAFSQKGWGQQIQDSINIVTVENVINYIELPIYMRWSLLGDSKFNININAGCYAAYAISQNTTLVKQDSVNQRVAIYDINTDNRGDFGFIIGLGISYKFNFGYLQLEGAFKSGFANILPVSHITKENPVVSTNQTPTFLFSYLIPINRGKHKDK
jgi:predicted nucleic acid-binding protein